MKKMFKFENDLSSHLIDNIFQVWKNTLNLRHLKKIANDTKNSVQVGLETISYHAPQLQKLVPSEIKQSLSVSAFKKKIWHCGNCTCRLCKTFIANVSFV